MRVKKCLKKMLVTLMAISMAAASISVPTKAADTFNYVTIGASNTNGYGLRGYITEEELSLLLSGQVSKDDVNVYGYQRSPEGAYTDLVRDYFTSEGKTVNLSQLAISSMRAEEVRILLDESYNGDDYSEWRFTGDDGWFRSAEEGGIPALREAYQESIANADLITLDIGWNNFGVYVCNQIADYLNNGRLKWSVELSDIFETEAEVAAAEEAKDIVRGYVETYVGAGEMADVVTDIFAYSLLGYIHNFDICMSKIYELNPDVDVVVLGIQNLLHGVVCEMDGTEILLGEIFGNFVNMANYYISACSPYQEDYQYVKAGGDDEHVTLFLDDIKSYNGDAENLNQNIKDCFDYYDNDLFIQTRIDYMAAAMIQEQFSTDELSAIGCETPEEAVALGKEGKLNDGLGSLVDAQGTFDSMYWPALYSAYDTLSQLVKEVANYESVVVDGLLSGTADMGAIEDAMMTTIEDEITENALAAANGEAYTVDLNEILTDDNADVVAAIYIRFYMGNSFFAHPSEKGHEEIKDAIVNIINNPGAETDQKIKDELAASVAAIQQLLASVESECKVHDYEETEVVPATTKKDGYIEKVCSVCGEEEKEVIPYPKTIKLAYTSAKYTGKQRKGPAVTVKGSDGKVIDSSNYKVTQQSGRTKVGRYKVTIKFKGDYYTGSVAIYWKIKPNPTSISKVTAASNSITVKWKKQTTQTDGYQVQYSRNKSFEDHGTKNIKKNTTTSKKIKDLKSGKTYYVRVRTYKNVKINGETVKYVSSWSEAKKIKTK